jgi:tetratricopeptide (TPR) repeat protein
MRIVALLIATQFSVGCTFSLDWIRHFQAQRAIQKQNFNEALPILHQTVIQRPDSEDALMAARQGARIAHLELKNYRLAVDFYKHIVLRSPDAEERKSAQRFIAQIYFENLQDFDQSVTEYEKLLKLENTREEAFRYRLNLAKSQFQMNNLDQALSELEQLIAMKMGGEGMFEIHMLKGNILVSNKQMEEAARQFESVLKDFPERATKESVALNLVVCYEDLKEFGKAIEVLENMRETYPNPEFLEARITRLQERKANLPGAQGWKR